MNLTSVGSVDGNGGALCAHLAERFADQDAARMAELDRLTGTGSAKHPPTQETRMACPECKSPTCHKRDCSRRPGATGTPAPTKTPERAPPSRPAPKAPAARAVRAEDFQRVDVSKFTTDALLDLRHAIACELKARRDAAEDQLRQLTEALGEVA